MCTTTYSRYCSSELLWIENFGSITRVLNYLFIVLSLPLIPKNINRKAFLISKDIGKACLLKTAPCTKGWTPYLLSGTQGWSCECEPNIRICYNHLLTSNFKVIAICTFVKSSHNEIRSLRKTVYSRVLHQRIFRFLFRGYFLYLSSCPALIPQTLNLKCWNTPCGM